MLLPHSAAVALLATALLAPAAPAHATVATCHGVRATIVGTSASDVIHGTAGRDVIAGHGGNDTIFARGGNDLVCGGEGADHLYGGPGSDRLYGERDLLHGAQEDGSERVGDTLSGGPGNDRLSAGVDRRRADNVSFDVFSWDASAHGVHIDLRTGRARGEGVDRFAGGTFTVVGSSHGDVVEGTRRRDRIDTGPGPDVVRARGGADTVVVDGTHGGSGGEGDRVWGGGGDDRITARQGQDHLVGGAGNDWIEALGAGNDVLTGGPGDDQFYGQIGDTHGPQSFNGGRGSDTLQINSDAINPKGDASTGVWNMETGAMRFTLGRRIRLSVSHIDRAIFATWGTSWTVTGTSGDDLVTGTSNQTAPTRFDGLAGDDIFRGSDGDDVFDGGPGQDQSFGMFDGDDTCISVETIDGADCEHVTP